MLVREPQASWVTVLPEDWGEDLASCRSATGRAVYLHDGTNLAWTVDAGTSWQRTVSRDAVAPHCGFGGGHLWLQLQGVRIYRLPADS